MSKHVNWHLGFSCALQNDLRDYADQLVYDSEYAIGNNYFRIDLLVIRRLSDAPIRKILARDFRAVNLFEFKGPGSSIDTRSYYKLIGLAGLYINQEWNDVRHSAADVTLHLLSRKKPVKLFRHLRTIGRTVAKIAPGIYNISNETFLTRVIVTRELSDEDYLYLRCLTNDLTAGDTDLTTRLAGDYKQHEDQFTYLNYMEQLASAYTNHKEDKNAMPESLVKLCDMVADRIREDQRQKDQVLIDKERARADLAISKAERLTQQLLALGIQPEV